MAIINCAKVTDINMVIDGAGTNVPDFFPSEIINEFASGNIAFGPLPATNRTVDDYVYGIFDGTFTKYGNGQFNLGAFSIHPFSPGVFITAVGVEDQDEPPDPDIWIAGYGTFSGTGTTIPTSTFDSSDVTHFQNGIQYTGTRYIVWGVVADAGDYYLANELSPGLPIVVSLNFNDYDQSAFITGIFHDDYILGRYGINNNGMPLYNLLSNTVTDYVSFLDSDLNQAFEDGEVTVFMSFGDYVIRRWPSSNDVEYYYLKRDFSEYARINIAGISPQISWWYKHDIANNVGYLEDDNYNLFSVIPDSPPFPPASDPVPVPLYQPVKLGGQPAPTRKMLGSK